MKKIFTCLMALLAIAAAATGPARAQNASPDVTLDFTTNSWGFPEGSTNKTLAANSYTSGDYTITLQGGGSSNGYYFHNNGYLFLGKSGAYLQLPAFGSPVEKIEVVGTSTASTAVLQNIYVGETAVSTQTEGMKDVTQTYVINEDYRAAGNSYTLKVGSAHNTQITYIMVYYVSAGGGSNPEPPTPGQNATTYNVTFGGFSASELNTTVNVTSLPQTFTQIGDAAFYPWTVISTSGNIFYGATVTSGGEDKVSVSVTSDEMSITVSGPFEGTATIHVTGEDDENRDISCDITVSCVAVAPAAPVPHTVRLAEGTEEAANWSLASGNSSATGTQVLEDIIAGSTLTATYTGTRKVKSVKAVKYVDPMTLPLTMEALTDGNIKVNIDGTLSTGMKYSVNGGAKNLITTTTTIDVAAGDKVQFYGNGTSTQAYGLNPVVTLLGTAQTKVYGNIMSLLDEDNFATLTALPNQGYVFYGLFRNNANLTDASGLLLPATTLANQCYYVMFYGCSSLTAAPALPATTLAQGCYNSMFQNCSTLTAAPVLPATTLAQGCYNSMFKNCSTLTAAPVLPADSMVNSCYSNMFNGCSSLTAAPALPSTTLALNCYYQMFYGCSSLTSAPVLPAQTLVGYCYYQMFYGCSSLTAAPALPATTLANHCYRQMFQNCSSLTAAPALPATTLANYCYQSMFQGCEALTAAPELPAQMLVSYCYYQMFYGCSNLNSVTCLATSGINQNNSTESWLNGAGSDVQGTKTFTADPNATWPTDVNGIPDGWARVNADE